MALVLLLPIEYGKKTSNKTFTISRGHALLFSGTRGQKNNNNQLSKLLGLILELFSPSNLYEESTDFVVDSFQMRPK